ncbi:MAG: ATP-dependent DNA helicase [Micromonosporaceae bacterium]|nr:ATP-dependent DNA helicase [Micromonosporaceae bacterium]
MAQAVEEAIATGEHLLAQAGTGTGKSLAYLAPALLVNGPVVISTATLALQAQLIESDLPRLADAVEPLLGRRPTFAVLKGRHHYACLAKLEAVDEPADDGLFGDPGAGSGKTVWLGEVGRMGQQVARVREWALESEAGDRDELDPGVDDKVWRTVSMPARECIGATRCEYGDDCFAELSRATARQADIVVTNHSLLAVDMLNGRHILPPHQVLVIDEAHELADRVTSTAQAELSADAVDRAARRARTHIDADLHERLEEAADGLTVALADAPVGRLRELPTALAETLTLVDAACRAAAKGIGEIRAEDSDAVRRKPAKATLDQLAEVAQRLLEFADHDVVWTEGDRRSGIWGSSGGAPAIGASSIVVAPLSVSGLLGVHLYDDRTVIATSATLALGGKFDSMARALGLMRPVAATADEPDAEAPPWRELDVGSPFDYAKQAILYVAAHLPRPTQSGLSDAAADELVRLASAMGGRTLGLFSSRRAAERAAEVVRGRTDLTVLLQGEESLPALVRRFKDTEDTCLFGVMSLWQGVDVPGDACQLVVIDRLPFPRPDEPIAAARAEAVDASGGSGFAAVSVPAAAVRLAQGAGRLIRRSTDRGVVAVLDSRLHHSRSYGSYLLKSLPPFWQTTNPEVVLGALKRLASV